jgi:hypothetical protein
MFGNRLAVGSVAFLVCASCAPALAHEAPSGWAYAPECCANHDCHEISDDAVSLVPRGWRIKATGEVFDQSSVRQSKDGRFHRCSAQGRTETRTFCLYVPDFGS